MTADLLEGAWDVHVHAGPSLFPRWGDGWDLAGACAAAGMAGFVLKAHHGSTVETAHLLGRQFPGLTVLGGVALNGFVGGLNPLAVELCLALGGRVVWLPTIHARHHGERIGLGGFSFQSREMRHGPARGYAVLEEGGELCAAALDVMALLDRTGAVLATGHIAPDEVYAVQRAIAAQGWSIPLLVNHVFFRVPSLTVSQLRQLANPWTFFEACYLTVSPPVRAARVEAVAAGIAAVPEGRWILASDSGQADNPPAPRALARFCEELGRHGIARSALSRMLRDAPAELLGHAAPPSPQRGSK
jgi:hypothetical protein